jgi:hypothetical protein
MEAGTPVRQPYVKTNQMMRFIFKTKPKVLFAEEKIAELVNGNNDKG